MNTTIEERQANLFEAKDSLVHCVSVDLEMGKGIAVEFKRRFGGVEELKNQHKQVGQVAVLERDDRYIYYLITKQRYWGKPLLASLEQALIACRNHCEANNVTSLSMPRIGCGLDRLHWTNDVKPLLASVFNGSCVANINVYWL